VHALTHVNHESQHSEALEHSQSEGGGVFGGRYAGQENLRHEILGDAVADGILGDEPGNLPPDGDGEDGGEARKKWKMGVQGMSTTQWLARKHGVTGRRKMYVSPILYPRMGKSGEVNMARGEGEGSKMVQEGYVLMDMFLQVSSILFSVLELDKAVSLVLPSRRSHRCPDNGLFLHTHVSLLRLQPRPHSAYKRPLLFRFQSLDLRLARQLSADGCRTRGCRVSARRDGSEK